MRITAVNKQEQGFTLIELLVVIGILAVLGAVAIPAYSRFFGSGEGESNATELIHLQDAMDSMMADNRIEAVMPSAAPVRNFSTLPEGTGAESLYPGFLRTVTTKCSYTWGVTGILNQVNCVGDSSGSEVFTTDALAGLVNDLESSGSLTGGQANALTSKLDQAAAEVEAGHTAEAISTLNDFVNQANAHVNGGVLQPAEAQPLLDEAQSLLEQLSGG